MCECVFFLIDYPKINENRSRAHVRVYGFKFCKIRPFLERMFIVGVNIKLEYLHGKAALAALITLTKTLIIPDVSKNRI